MEVNAVETRLSILPLADKLLDHVHISTPGDCVTTVFVLTQQVQAVFVAFEVVVLNHYQVFMLSMLVATYLALHMQKVLLARQAGVSLAQTVD